MLFKSASSQSSLFQSAQYQTKNKYKHRNHPQMEKKSQQMVDSSSSSCSRIKFKTIKQFNHLVEQGRAASKSIDGSRIKQLFNNPSNNNNHNSFRQSINSFSHHFVSENNIPTHHKQTVKQPSSENQLLITLSSDISNTLKSMKNGVRLYSASDREKKEAHFLDEEFSIKSKPKGVQKDNTIIRRSSCDCGKCGGQSHKLQKLKGLIPQFLPRQVIRDSVKSKLKNAQRTIRRLSMFFRLTNSQTHTNTPNTIFKRRSTLAPKYPKQESETKLIYPCRDKIDQKTTIQLSQVPSSGAGRILARKGSCIQILPRKQENCRLFKANSTTDFDFMETPKHHRKESIDSSSDSSSSSSSGDSTNRNGPEKPHEMDTLNQFDKILSRVDDGFLEELAHIAQDKLDKEQSELESQKEHRPRWIDHHSYKIERKGIHKSYAKYLTPPHPTLLQILNKPRLPLPHSQAVISSCKSDRISTLIPIKKTPILELQELIKPADNNEEILLSSERQSSVLNLNSKKAVSLSLIPSSPQSNSSQFPSKSCKNKITLSDKERLLDASTSNSQNQSKSRIKFNPQISSFSQLSLAKYNDTSFRRVARKTVPSLGCQFLVPINQEPSEDCILENKSNHHSASLTQQSKNNDEQSIITLKKQRNVKHQRLSNVCQKGNSSDSNREQFGYYKCQSSVFLSNTSTDFSVKRDYYCQAPSRSEYFPKNETSILQSTKSSKQQSHSNSSQKYPQQKQEHALSLLGSRNQYSQMRSQRVLSKSQAGSITKIIKTISESKLQQQQQYQKDDEERSQSKNKEKQQQQFNGKLQKIVFSNSKKENLYLKPRIH